MKFVLAIATIVALFGIFTVEGATAHASPSYSFYYNTYGPVARNYARMYGIPENAFVAQINMESGFNPNAVSPGGDKGIAQISPGTGIAWGVNPFNPYASLQTAAYHMALYKREFGGDYRKAIAAYNSGEGTVQWAVRRCGGNWFHCLPGGVQHYVNAIY